jgi:hypothetical protein
LSQELASKEEIKIAIKKLLFADLNRTGKDLKVLIEKEFPCYSATERTYQNLKNEVSSDVIALRQGVMEQRWNLGMLTYAGSISMPIPPDAILRILQIKEKANYPITLRRARWIAYLSPLIEKNDLLKDISFQYAALELIADLSGESFSSSEYDIDLIDKSKQPALLRKLAVATRQLDWLTQTKIIAKLTDYEAIPYEEVIFSKGTAYGILKDGRKFKFGNAIAIRYLLKRKGLIGKSKTTDTGDEIITLNRIQLPTQKQLRKLIKDGKK